MFLTKNRLFKWVLYSNAIYVFLFFLFKPQGIGFKKITISLFLIFSVLGLFFLVLKSSYRLKSLSRFVRLLFYLLILWSVVIIVRSFSSSIQDWVTNFGNVYMALAWLTPLVMILGLKIENWKIVFKSIIFMFSLMILAFLFLPFLELNDEWIWLLRPLTFILLIGVYRYSPINRLLIYLIIGIYIAISIMGGRRAEFLFLFMVAFFIVFDKLIAIGFSRSLIKYIILIFLILLFCVFAIGYEHISNFIAYFIDFQDSRTFLFSELMAEFNFKEKIFGRGSLGTYYSEYMEHTKQYTVEILKQNWWGDSSTRITIEVGYLQMILKGGFILFLLNLAFLILSSYLAIFKSNNKFIKRLGYFILIMAMMSIVEFRPTFTPSFIILWMAMGTVFVKKFRDMSDSEVDFLIVIR